MENIDSNKLQIIANMFCLQGEVQSILPYGNGHINDTYLVVCKLTDTTHRYILQGMNTAVFKKPDELIENIKNVTEFLKAKIEKQGGDSARETLTLIPGKNGEPCIHYEDGVYRVYDFIEKSICFETVLKTQDFYNCGKAFGNFQGLLSDFPAEKLFEVIPDFHNTVSRFNNLKRAINENKCDRLKLVQKEVDFALNHEADCKIIVDALADKKIPLRVTHNDTKLNNIMFDEATNAPLCVIDLDTVMPGSALYDYGDSIRFGANTGAEDETDLSLIGLNLELFEAYTKGYIEGCKGVLTDKELELLPMAAKLMTLECGMRFLTDYLEGDTYFRIHRPDHNLDRCRTQFKLVADMEDKWDEMQEIVRGLRK